MTKADVLRCTISKVKDREGNRTFTYQLQVGTRQTKVAVNTSNPWHAMELLADSLGCKVDEIGPRKPE